MTLLLISLCGYCVGMGSSKYLDVKSGLKVMRVNCDVDSIYSISIFILNWTVILFAWVFILSAIPSSNNYNWMNVTIYLGILSFIILFNLILLVTTHSFLSSLSDNYGLTIFLILLLLHDSIIATELRSIRLNNFVLQSERSIFLFSNNICTIYVRFVSRHYNPFWIQIVLLFLII